MFPPVPCAAAVSLTAQCLAHWKRRARCWVDAPFSYWFNMICVHAWRCCRARMAPLCKGRDALRKQSSGLFLAKAGRDSDLGRWHGAAVTEGLSGDSRRHLQRRRQESGHAGASRPRPRQRDLSLWNPICCRVFALAFFSSETHVRIRAATMAARNPAPWELCSGNRLKPLPLWRRAGVIKRGSNWMQTQFAYMRLFRISTAASP